MASPSLILVVTLVPWAPQAQGPAVQSGPESCPLVFGRLQEPEPAPPPVDPVAVQLEQLLRSVRDDPAPPDEDIRAAIAALGPSVAGPAVTVLATRLLDVVEGHQPQKLSIPQETLLLDALGRLPRDAVLGSVDRLLDADRGQQARAAAIRATAAVGAAADLPRLLELVGPRRDEPIPRKLDRALAWGVERLVRRDAATLEEIEDLWRELDDELLTTIVLALGRTEEPLVIEFLAEVLLWRPEHVRLVVPQIPLIGPSPEPATNAVLARQLRVLFDPRDAQTARPMMQALAVLQDFEATPLMIDLLRSESASLRDSAAWSLRELTSLPFPADHALWSNWYRRELEWFDHNETSLANRLDGANEALVAATIRDMAHRRLHRHDLADVLAETLDHASPEIRALACQALGQLRSERAVEALIRALGDKYDSVQTAAGAALRSITGRDLPATREAWVVAHARE